MKSNKMRHGMNNWAGKICTLSLSLMLGALGSSAIAQQASFAVNNQGNPLKSYIVPSNRESHPFFIDIDGDNDLDCFSGEYTNGQVSKIYFYRNDGTNKSPLFKSINGQANPLGSVEANMLSIPYFIDIDGDGDYDCFIGEGTTGALMYYENTGSATKPNFVKQSAAFNPLSMVKFSTSDVANPAFADIDGDGDFDCLVADEAGLLHYFKNIGNVKNPSFVHVEDAESPFQSLSANGGIYNVSFQDWNNDGLIDLFVNTTYYKNVGSRQRPRFAAVSGDEQPLLQGAGGYQFTYNPLRWVDLNNDGTKEVVQGNASGGFVYQTLTSGKPIPASKAAIAVQVSPNPSKAAFTLHLPIMEPSVIRVVDVQGKVLSTQIATSSTVKFGADLKPGIYILQVMQKNIVVYNQKIVKE